MAAAAHSELLDLEEVPHRVALATSSTEALAQGVPGLLRLLENLRLEEVDPRHRRLRLNNATLQERVFRPLPGAFDLLCALGYTPVQEDGETCLCLDTARHSSAAAAKEVSWLQGLIERRWQPQPWPCPACTLQNAAGAGNCAACDGPRPAWASLPALPKPRLAAAQTKPAPAGAQEEEQQRRAEGLQRALTEKQRERERILAEARADRQRFHDIGAGEAPSATAAASPATMTAQAATQAMQQPSSATLRIRLPDGAVLEETFEAAAPLSRVFDCVDSLLVANGELAEDYTLLQAIPRRAFLREVLGGRSLADLGLAPSSTLSVLRNEDRGRVQSGGVETALITGAIEGLSYEELQELEERMGDAGKRPRRASSQAREACSRVHPYEGGGVASGSSVAEERRCAICLVDFEAGIMLRTLWCGHKFHQMCIDKWLTDKDECPICRMALQAS